jgi:hypothetical protein
MSITLDDVLMLTGRLDDSPGFDVPRERFRRYLGTHLSDAGSARAVIEPCQQLVDEQHHRALQDLVVVLGRPLGFETSFGSYAPATGGEGCWRSPGRLVVAIELRTNQTSGADFDRLSHTMAAHLAASHSESSIRVIGLSVVTPLYPARDRLERQVADRWDTPIRIVSVRSLLVLADMATAGRLQHGDIVRLLDTVPSLDFVAGLLGATPSSGAPAPSPAAGIQVTDVRAPTSFWLAAVTGDNVITAERFLEVVVRKRGIFGVRDDAGPSGAARPGDRICFFLAGRGVVGHGNVAEIGPTGAGLRDGHQYSQLLRLEHTRLYLDAPVAPEIETTLRLSVARGDRAADRPAFLRITEREFLALTREQSKAADVPRVLSTAVSDAASR